ncbi:uncharacterized protein LOC110990193 [Acanthaster planci]|uniref:Uncharacterized protein LOC110990193 n=1 Tax=Acanthaster planci TaxID=133434 RepID=A0A8B7ZZD3_ACAPL|nr:uncharacterized protein LOC110990193 [Acanthaster planci]
MSKCVMRKQENKMAIPLTKSRRCMHFSVVFLVKLSMFTYLILDIVHSAEDKEISQEKGTDLFTSENHIQGRGSPDSASPDLMTSAEQENEEMFENILEKTWQQIGDLHGGIRPEVKMAKEGTVVTGKEYKRSRPDSSTPMDYIQLLASYMRPEVFHKFIEGLNKTLDAHKQYSHPEFTYVNTTEIHADGSQQHKVKYPCMHRPTGNRTLHVKIVNNTEMMELVSSVYHPPSQDNSSSVLGGYCAFVMFYAPWCKFSAKAAPAFNAIGRAFPDLEVLAIDAFQYNSLNTRFGIVAVPNVLLFHNSKPVMRFNYSQRTFDVFSGFIRNFTGLEPNSSVQVSEEDYLGPVPSVATEESDYALWLSWLFLITVLLWFLQQQVGSIIMDRIRVFAIYARQVWRTGELYDQVGVLVHEHHD